jgi:hypothetical protein
MNQSKNQYKRRSSERITGSFKKTKSAVYRSLDDFLRKIPIAASNQFGDLVIMGTRIA